MPHPTTRSEPGRPQLAFHQRSLACTVSVGGRLNPGTQNLSGEAHMKFLVVICLTLLICAPSTLKAQTSQQRNPPSFNAFFVKFKAAVARNDKEAVAAMTKLPFLFDSEERDREGFIKIYDQLFTRSVKRCFSREKPLKEGDMYEIFCGETIFLFGRVDGEYKFV